MQPQSNKIYMRAVTKVVRAFWLDTAMVKQLAR